MKSESKNITIGSSPEWTHRAKILSALYRDIPNLFRAHNEFGANGLILYCCPEITNGWCPAGTWEQVEEFIVRAHEQNLKVICYYDTTLAVGSFYLNGHQSWAQRNAQGEPEHYQPGHIRDHRYAFCYNSPWSNWVATIAERYVHAGADGLLLDNPGYYGFTGPLCFCDNCNQKSREQTGKGIAELTDVERVRFLQNSIQFHVRRVYSAMRQAAPADRALVILCNTSSSRNPTKSLECLGEVENVLFREIVVPESEDYESEIQCARDRYPDKPIWSILTEPSGKKNGWQDNPEEAAKDFDRILIRMYALGMRPVVWSTIPSQNPQAPGFTEVSIYTNDTLAAPVKKHFLLTFG